MDSLYERVLDFFLSTYTGQWSMSTAHLTRDQLLARMHAQFPTEPELETMLDELLAKVGKSRAQFEQEVRFIRQGQADGKDPV